MTDKTEIEKLQKLLKTAQTTAELLATKRAEAEQAEYDAELIIKEIERKLYNLNKEVN